MLDWRRVYWPAMAIRIIPGIVSGDRITPIYKPWKGHLEEVPTTLKGLAITLVIKHVLTGMIQVHGRSRTGYTSKMTKERLFTNAKPPPHKKKTIQALLPNNIPLLPLRFPTLFGSLIIQPHLCIPKKSVPTINFLTNEIPSHPTGVIILPTQTMH